PESRADVGASAPRETPDRPPAVALPTSVNLISLVLRHLSQLARQRSQARKSLRSAHLQRRIQQSALSASTSGRITSECRRIARNNRTKRRRSSWRATVRTQVSV